MGHFLERYVVVVKNGKPIERLLAVDTDLLVAQRVVGFNQSNGELLTDLTKVDEVLFHTDEMPEELKDLLPDNFKSMTGRIFISTETDLPDKEPLKINLEQLI
jgi:hypothetical protein